MSNYSTKGSLMDAVETVYNELEGSRLDPAIVASCDTSIGEIASFFNCDKEEALALAVLLQLFYDESPTSIKEMIKHLGGKPSLSHHFNYCLSTFVAKKLIRPLKDPSINPMTGYVISDDIIRAINTGKWDHMQKKEVKTHVDLIIRFNQLLNLKTKGLRTYTELMNESEELVKSNTEIPLASMLVDKKFDKESITVALKVCALALNSEEITIYNIIDSLKPDYRNRLNLVASLKKNTNELIKSKFMSLKSKDVMFGEQQFELCEKAQFELGRLENNIELTNFKSLQKITPDSIIKKALHFNKSEEESIGKLFDLVKEKNFNAFRKRMMGLKMKPGITILMHGAPGTGKTESVLQMAKMSGRTILKADVSTIRNKFVGDTEKAIQELFSDYKRACKNFKKTPILLFNEADSILTTRRSIERSVDQMENTMQNIILEELENFEGIFVATTNLEANLDKAFERRFLYKLKMEKPAPKIRMAIWKSKLNSLPEDVLEEVAENYELSGGQIDNVAKKLEVDYLLNGEKSTDKSYLKNLIKAENSLNGDNQHRVVGFKIPQRN